jgi:serine/threonine-protein kinase
MSDSHDDNGTAAQSLDALLDGGLRAAFEGEAEPDLRGMSVLESLHHTLGVQPRVLLRETRDEPSPVAVAARVARQGSEALIGRYHIAGEIACGGVGVVLKGRDPDLGRDVAIKVLRAEHSARAEMVDRFVEEAQIAAQLQHPGILPVYELGIADARRPYFSMKLIKGRTLAALLAERTDPSRDRPRFLGIFEQVCQAMGYAHAKGVVHRDLKPSNVMVGAFGEVQVVDWGLAKVLAQRGAAEEHGRSDDASMVETLRTESAAQSMAGSVFGTPAYMSPEQARGEVEQLDERSDVFSLGAILCEILTGSPPFSGDRRAALQQARNAGLDDANRLLTSCEADAELVSVARRCLSANAADRPRDAGTVAEQVSAYLALLAERARNLELTAARSAAVARHERRARRLTLALASVILVAVCGLSAGTLWIQHDRASREAVQAAAVNRTIDTAAQLLGQAIAAPLGQARPWFEVRSAAKQIEQRLQEGPVDADTRRRAEGFLQHLATADLDYRVVNTIEETVIAWGTHSDRDSWIRLEEQLRLAFLDYGIDLQKLSPREAAERIAGSAMAPYLTDGLELWIATNRGKNLSGVRPYGQELMRTWKMALDEADPDPFTTAVRDLVWLPCYMNPEDCRPTAEQVRRLVDAPEFNEARPRTLSWLATAAFQTEDPALGPDTYKRALLIHPDDLMLNFDFASMMTANGQPEQAIRSYDRCIALRPRSGGLWRSLGVALRMVDDFQGSADALRRSIEHQPDHATTHEDLGVTLQAAGDLNGAILAFEQALQLNPDLETAREHLEEVRRSGTNPRE